MSNTTGKTALPVDPYFGVMLVLLPHPRMGHARSCMSKEGVV